MPEHSKSLFHRIEKALEAMARGSHPLETIRLTAQFLVDQFSQELGLIGGRIYAAENAHYELVETFGCVSKAPVGLRIPRSYAAFEQLLDEGAIIMDRSAPSLDETLEAELGTRDRFAAIVVADGDYVLSFDVDPAADARQVLPALNLFRLAINQKLREERMQMLLEDAQRIQSSILPKRIPRYGDYELAARSVPAELVGGDFFDFITMSDTNFYAVLADAAGHGLPAALQVRDVYTGLRMGLLREYKITRTLERLNQIIHRSRLATKFVSLVLAELEIGGTVLYANAGHPPPILVRAGGSVELLETRGMILGPRPMARYPIDLVRLLPGDVLALYSDGITEATHHESGEELGQERLVRLLVELRGRPAGEILEAVFERVEAFTRRTPPADDQTMVLIKRSTPTRKEVP